MTLAMNPSRGFLEAVRRSLWWVPNALTSARIVAAVLILGLFVWPWVPQIEIPQPASYRMWGFQLMSIAVATDLLDGWTARTFGWVTPTGKWLDPAADKAISIGAGVVVPIEYGPGWYLIPYVVAGFFLLKFGWETSQLRWEQMRKKIPVSGANYMAQVKTFVLLGAQFVFMACIAFEENLGPEGHGILFSLALGAFVASAFLNKLSLDQYRREIG